MLIHAWLFAITINAHLQRQFASMVISVVPRHGAEAAAWIVVRDDGTLTCEMWPASYFVEKQVFRGRMPANVVAVVHTHPEGTSPKPSLTDIDDAKRLGVPFYVLTRWTIYAADETGRVHRLIAGWNWVSEAYQQLRFESDGGNQVR